VSLLQVDDQCASPGWDAGGQKGAWSWRPGPELSLTAGRHTLRFLGAVGGSNLDRVVLTTAPPTKTTPR
jgi:hypothetical protein